MKQVDDIPTIRAPARPRITFPFNPLEASAFLHTQLESPIYRLVQKAEDGPVESVIVNDEAECKRILLNKEGIWLKGPQTYEPFLSLVPKHLIGLEGEYHAKLRARAQGALGDALAEGRIPGPEMARRLIEAIEKGILTGQSWMGSTGKLNGQKVFVTTKIDYMFRATALDIVSTSVFGQRWGVIDDYTTNNVKAHTLAKLMQELHWRVSDFNLREWRRNPRVEPVGPLLDILDSFVLDEIDKAYVRVRSSETDTCMLDAWARDTELSREEVRNLCMTFLTMGSENVSTAISWCAVLLSEHQDEQEIARQSKDALTNAFNEGVRLYPSVPVLTRMANQDTVICGYRVPRFTEIIVNMYSVHRNPVTWGDNAEEFQPKRCPVISADGPPDAFPFGGGARTCIGRPLTAFELQSVLGQVLQRFQLVAVKPSDDKPDEFVVDESAQTTPNNFVSLRPGEHMIAFVPRQQAKL